MRSACRGRSEQLAEHYALPVVTTQAASPTHSTDSESCPPSCYPRQAHLRHEVLELEVVQLLSQGMLRAMAGLRVAGGMDLVRVEGDERQGRSG